MDLLATKGNKKRAQQWGGRPRPRTGALAGPPAAGRQVRVFNGAMDRHAPERALRRAVYRQNIRRCSGRCRVSLRVGIGQAISAWPLPRSLQQLAYDVLERLRRQLKVRGLIRFREGGFGLGPNRRPVSGAADALNGARSDEKGGS